MPGGEIFGTDVGIGGDWPGGRGAAGHYMKSSDGATLISSLPANLTVTAVPPEPRYWTNESDSKWLARPPGDGSGGRTLHCWVRSSNPSVFTFDLSDSSPILVAQYSTAIDGSTWSFEIASGDGSTVYASQSSGQAVSVGVWTYCRIWGPGPIRITTGPVRVQGFVFDQDSSPGRLVCFEPGSVGLVG
jgi:hypothetical protein